MQNPDQAFIASQLRQPHGTYAKEVAAFMMKSNRHIYDLAYSNLDLADKQRVLEIGMADGSFLQQLFQINPTIQYTGVDFSKEMVDSAKEKHSSLMAEKNISFIHSNIDDYQSADAFDRIFTVNTIYFWNDTLHTLIHLKKLLAKNGKLIIAFRNNETMENLPFTKFGFKLFSVSMVEEYLKAAGFTTYEFKTSEETIRLHDGSMVPLTNFCAIASN